jgi:hypothetical protein
MNALPFGGRIHNRLSELRKLGQPSTGARSSFGTRTAAAAGGRRGPAVTLALERYRGAQRESPAAPHRNAGILVSGSWPYSGPGVHRAPALLITLHTGLAHGTMQAVSQRRAELRVWHEKPAPNCLTYSAPGTMTHSATSARACPARPTTQTGGISEPGNRSAASSVAAGTCFIGQ